MAETATPPLPDPRAASTSAAAAQALRLGAGQQRVRLAMYLAFATLLLAVLAHGWSTLRLEDLRATDAEIIDQAVLQRTLSLQAGRLAALLVSEPGDRGRHTLALAALLVRSRGDALTLDELLARQMARSAGIASNVGPALEAWHGARERLWYRGELLLRLADAGSEEDLARGAAAMQAETEPALVAAQNLSATLRLAAAQRGLGLKRELTWGVGVLLALLVGLSLAVVEPTARSVRRHAQRLFEQAAELRRLALVAEHTAALVLVTDARDRVLWGNAAYLAASGWTLAEALGRDADELLAHPQADTAALQRVQHAVRHRLGLRLEWLHQARDGRDLWLDVDLRPVYGEHGELEGYVRVCSDVTARAQQQAKLQALWAALPAGVVVQAANGEIVESNRAAERLLGLTQAQLRDRDSLDARWHVVREDGSAYPGAEHPAMRTLASGLALRNQTMGIHTPDGELRWLIVNTEPQRDTLGQLVGVVTCFSDITESRLLQDRLSDSARTDALTRLPNRSVVMERLQRAIEHARRHPGYGFAVLFMDFDRLKQANDTLGHAAGDELLRQIALRLAHTLRPGDVLGRVDTQTASQQLQTAARLGGDEFVAVLEGVNDADTVKLITQRLLQELAEPYLVGHTPVQSSASIGVVLYSDAAVNAEDPVLASAENILRNADTAMYEAKRAGRGRWVMFDNSMHERVLRALAVESDLCRALKEDELFVVYQPAVDLATRALVGVEALVRWRHPTRGLVGPVDFIGVAEECGLIDALGAVVLGKACEQFMRWQHELGSSAPWQMAVNLSRAQLERAALADEVRQVLHDCGMRPEQLQLEITESLAAQDERVLATLRQLKSLGVRLALDDFGTGYSSLACLHQMPVDTVKVDRSFVQHAQTVEHHRVLIEATIRVARTLGMTTVAEGIETAAQAALMQGLDCDRGQGFLFSRPLEAADLARWALAHAQGQGLDLDLSQREAADTV